MPDYVLFVVLAALSATVGIKSNKFNECRLGAKIVFLSAVLYGVSAFLGFCCRNNYYYFSAALSTLVFVAGHMLIRRAQISRKKQE